MGGCFFGRFGRRAAIGALVTAYWIGFFGLSWRQVMLAGWAGCSDPLLGLYIELEASNSKGSRATRGVRASHQIDIPKDSPISPGMLLAMG